MASTSAPRAGFRFWNAPRERLHEAFPDVLLMTTSYDDSFGLESEVKTMGAWCRSRPSLTRSASSGARRREEEGVVVSVAARTVPTPTWFVESDAIEARFLMGAMTAKYRQDGFPLLRARQVEQQQADRDRTVHRVEPRELCHLPRRRLHPLQRPRREPVPTIRLENYRDGMEDFAYACILEECIRRYEAKGERLTAREREWLAKAREALPVPETLVNTVAEYSRDPKAVTPGATASAR